ncbi:unnamed protein product [Adineta ricciae]|nr:unnamed protein product [Adineta ricciae]
MQHYSPNEIMNTDQVGLEKELHSSRTLSYQGEKSTVSAVKSQNAISHSYTLQSTINLAGEVVGPIYLCLNEPTGRISENVQAKMFQPSNVVITCSKSGKLTKSLVHYWRDKVLAAIVHKKCLLLSDAWLGQGDEEIYKRVPGCKRLVIPKKTTDKIQPLDVFHNRQMKSIIRHAYDRVMLDQLPISMSTRNNIIRLVSLTHSQMSSKIFHGLIRYAWFASGYTDKHPGDFKTVDQNRGHESFWGFASPNEVYLWAKYGP